MARRRSEASSSPPQWSYVVAAVVAVAGLAWGVVSYFIPKPEAAKPSVTVSGSGSVGVGEMSGGSITNGQAPRPSRVE